MRLKQSWAPSRRHSLLSHHYLPSLCEKALQMLAGTLPLDLEAMHLYTSKPYPRLFLISPLPLKNEQLLAALLRRPDKIQIRVDGRTFPLGRVLCAMQDKVVPLDHEVSWNVSALVARATHSLVRIIYKITSLCLEIWTCKLPWPRGLSHPE